MYIISGHLNTNAFGKFCSHGREKYKTIVHVKVVALHGDRWILPGHNLGMLLFVVGGGDSTVSLFFRSGQPFICWGGERQQTRGPPRVTKALATPLGKGKVYTQPDNQIPPL